MLFNFICTFRFPDKSETCLKFHFLEILTKAYTAVNKSGHLRNSCRRLKIVHVSPQVAQVSRSSKEMRIYNA